jgi:transposase
VVLHDSEDSEEIIERVAALDMGKAELVVREATSDCWKPVFHLLEAQGLDPWPVNAKDVEHHAFLLATMPARIDDASVDIAAVETRIEELIAPFARAVERLDEITGVGPTVAHVIAVIGVDMSRFRPRRTCVPGHRFAPGVKDSARKDTGRGATGHGNPCLARVLGEAAVVAGRTDTFLGERDRRIARRRGRKRAVVTVGRSVLIIIWHLLPEPGARYHDLGPGLYDNRLGPDREKPILIHQLEGLGYKVTLEPAA